MITQANRSRAAGCTTQTDGHHIDWADVRAAATAEALLMAAVAGPSDLPATQLPDYEPTASDLLAIELLGDVVIDELIGSANIHCAYDAGHCQRQRCPDGDSQTNFPNTLERAA